MKTRLVDGVGGKANIYAVPAHIPAGGGFVTIDGLSAIHAITVYGNQRAFGAVSRDQTQYAVETVALPKSHAR